MRSQLFALLLASAAAHAQDAAQAPVNVPARFVAQRIFAQPRTQDGATLNLWVDSGGGGGPGMYLLTDATARRLHLATHAGKAEAESLNLAEPPHFAPGAGLPDTGAGQSQAIVVEASGFKGPQDATQYDGMLGAGYLAGDFATPRNIWTFDYPDGHLVLQPAGWQAPADAHATPLRFKTGADGHRQSGFPRIVVRVDGQPLSLLLDTGATGYPTPAAIAAQGGDAGVRATSFITTSQLDRWHAAHPDWRVVTDADRLHGKASRVRAIEVPAVDIAGWRTGPVWFTERADGNFHDFMSSMMDQRVEGALGGNALSAFVMTVDYGRARGWFQCRQRCRADRD